MFTELTKLFDRNFVIGYFLPAAAFVAVTLRINTAYQLFSGLIPKGHSVWEDASRLGILSWLIGLVLMALNTSMIRGMEGYWPFDLDQRLNGLEKWRFTDLQKRITALDKASSRPLRDRMAERFPDDPGSILPTSFGNTIRAFETYPRKMYGLDSIGGWFRLLAVTPKDYRELMDSAKAELDLWVNMFYLSLLVILGHLADAIWSGQEGAHWFRLIDIAKATWLIIVSPFRVLVPLAMANDYSVIWACFGRAFWPIVIAVLVVGLSYSMAKGAAIIWGEWVKSAFDLYLPELRKKLELPSPKDRDEERRIWQSFTRSIYYRDPTELPQKAEKAEAEELLDGLRKLENAQLLATLEAATRLIREDIRKEKQQDPTT